jgi:hypothetical protein
VRKGLQVTYKKRKRKKKKKIVLKEYKNLKRERMKEKDKLRWFGS